MSRKKFLDLEEMDADELEVMMMDIDESQAEDSEIVGDSDPGDLLPLSNITPRHRSQELEESINNMPSTSSASSSREEPPATPSLSASLQYDSPIQLRLPEISSRGKVSNRGRPRGRSLGRRRSSGCRSAVQSATIVADESDDESIPLNRQENDDPEDEF